MDHRRFGMALMLFAALTFALGACSSSDSGDEASPEAEASADMGGDTGGGGGVSATLADFSITLDAEGSIPKGMTTFDITNDGPGVHEFVVLSTDTDAGDLPVADDNTVDEAGMDLVDEVEDIEPGATASLEVDLKAGHYAIICNIPAHYEQGMFANLSVG